MSSIKSRSKLTYDVSISMDASIYEVKFGNTQSRMSTVVNTCIFMAFTDAQTFSNVELSIVTFDTSANSAITLLEPDILRTVQFLIVIVEAVANIKFAS